MTVKIHIPSSDAPDGEPSPLTDRPPPRLRALVAAGLLATVVVVASLIAVVSASDEPASEVPAPFETVAETVVQSRPEEWSARSMPGIGEVVAMGTAANAMLAVTVDGSRPLVWELDDGEWRLGGQVGVEWIDSAVVTDDRLLLTGRLGRLPAVWEWVGARARTVFQPTSGVITGLWSVGGRLVVATSDRDGGLEAALRYGRADTLWVESSFGTFDKVPLFGLVSVLSVDGADGYVVVGGIDADGRASFGFLYDGEVDAQPIPRVGEGSGVTDLDLRPDSVVALVTVVDAGTRSEIRVGEWAAGVNGALQWGGAWPSLIDTKELVGIEVIGDVVYGATPSGDVVSVALDGSTVASVSGPAWPYGFVRGVGALGEDPVLYGESEGRPTYVGSAAAEAEVVLPAGPWERYHTEEAAGFDLVEIGSVEFATRDGELFARSWSGERWHRAETGDLVLFASPTIVELDWGFVLVPAAGPGLWSSVDGMSWGLIPGSENVRVGDSVTDGETFVGITHLGSVGGPSSEITVVGRSGVLERNSLPYQLVGLLFEPGVGFAATIAPPETGHATSVNGIEWTANGGGGMFEWVVGLRGALYWGTGEPVTPGDASAEVPADDGWLFTHEGGVPVWQSESGDTWLYVDSAWEQVGLGVIDGLPARPHRIVVRDRRIFAMVETIDGISETYAYDLDGSEAG